MKLFSFSFIIAKLLQELQGNKKWSDFFVMLLRQSPYFATKGE